MVITVKVEMPSVSHNSWQKAEKALADSNEAEVSVPVLQGPCLSLAWNEAEMPLSIFCLSSVYFKFFEAFGATTIYKKQCFTVL